MWSDIINKLHCYLLFGLGARRGERGALARWGVEFLIIPGMVLGAPLQRLRLSSATDLPTATFFVVRLEEDFHQVPNKYASSTPGQCQALLSWRGLETGHHYSCLSSSCKLTLTRKSYVARRFPKCSGG